MRKQDTPTKGTSPPLWFEILDDRIWLQRKEIGEEEARFIRRTLGVRKGQSVLDAPCGTGRIGIHIAKAGYKVSLIDLQTQFIDRARKRFHNEGLEARIEVGDLRELDYVNEFHGIYNWFGSFGYFSDVENADLLQRYVRALRHGGRLLVEQINRERILRHFTNEVRNGDMITKNEWDKRNQRVIGHHIISGPRGSSTVSSMRLYTPGQLKGLFSKAGLVVEKVLGFPDGEPLTPSSQRVVGSVENRELS